MNIGEFLLDKFSIQNIFDFLASAVDKLFEVPVLGKILELNVAAFQWMPFPILFLFIVLYSIFMIRLVGKIVQLIFGVI